jgi:hypothetical protein
VQDGDEADFSAETLGGERHERLGRSAHQQAVDRLLVLESDLGRRRRQGEDDVEVFPGRDKQRPIEPTVLHATCRLLLQVTPPE